jgi:hypothetical protein
MAQALNQLLPPPEGKKRIVLAVGSTSPVVLSDALTAADPGMLIHGADAHIQAWADAAGVQALSMPRAGFTEARHAGAMLRVASLLGAVVVAFPGGSGTADCVSKARGAKLDVIEVTPSKGM